ncbi:uncharacterized protein V6R79_011920 [Siganus canaliculatus]
MSVCDGVNGAGDRLLFADGVKLIVSTGEDTPPSYYVLEDEVTTVCLATGFSRYKAVWSKPSKQSSATAAPPVNKAPPPTEDPNGPNGLFKDTEAVRVEDSSFYNQVALISSDEAEQQCAGDSGESGSCSRSMEPDPTVNLASLVTLGLRILFIKTIIFNVLMTLRLWISLFSKSTVTTSTVITSTVSRSTVNRSTVTTSTVTTSTVSRSTANRSTVSTYSQHIYSHYIYSQYIYSQQIYSQQIYSHYIYSQYIYSQQIYSQQIYSQQIYSQQIYSQQIYSQYIYKTLQTLTLISMATTPWSPWL